MGAQLFHHRPPLPERWAILSPEPWRDSSPGSCQRLAQWLIQSNGEREVAFVEPALAAWLPGGGDALEWHGRLAILRPRTWLPVRPWFPLDSNIAWNGSELFSRPRTGALLRGAGFARIDALVVADFTMVHLVRQAQARCLAVWLEDDPEGRRTGPDVVRRRAWEVIADADLLAVSRSELLAVKGASEAGRVIVPQSWSHLVQEVGSLISMSEIPAMGIAGG